MLAQAQRGRSAHSWPALFERHAPASKDSLMKAARIPSYQRPYTLHSTLSAQPAALVDRYWALALGLAGGASRLLFVRPTPINWDAVQFALAMDHFDLRHHEPHPPGYILYVLAGRVLNFLAGNASVALSLLSVLFSMAAIALLYRLALTIFEDRRIALGAALLLLASPLALYYGSVGLTYVPEMALSIVVGALAWQAKERPHSAQAVWLGVALAAAGGVRQSSLVVLLPLCVWALWRAGRRVWALFIVALGMACVVWLVPLLLMSGGVEAYLRESALQFGRVGARTSLLEAGTGGLLYNTAFEGLALALGLAFGLVPLGLWAVRLLRFSLAPRLKAFVLWWILPSLLFYAVSHVGQYGYLLVVLPPLLLLSALCALILANRINPDGSVKRRYQPRVVAACALVVLLSAGYFLLAQGPTTAANITGNDQHWRDIEATLSSVDTGQTALIMSMAWNGPFREAGYALPQFHSYALGAEDSANWRWLYSAYGGRSTYSLPVPAGDVYLALPPATRSVIALDDTTGTMLAGQKGVRTVALADGSSLYRLDSPAGSIQGLLISGETITAVYGNGGGFKLPVRCRCEAG